MGLPRHQWPYPLPRRYERILYLRSISSTYPLSTNLFEDALIQKILNIYFAILGSRRAMIPVPFSSPLLW